MKLISLVVMVLFLSGCAQSSRCIQCTTIDKKEGFRYFDKWDGFISHCVPCTKAKSQESRFVCFGEK